MHNKTVNTSVSALEPRSLAGRTAADSARNGPAEPRLSSPTISIVVPVLQEEKILEHTLSVFSKEVCARYNVELIVSDGGSTDKTLEIAQRYADKVIRHSGSERQTIAEGRNAGAKVARGDVLVFLNGDTIPAAIPDFFEAIESWNSATNKARPIALACPVKIPPQERQVRDVIFHTIYNMYVRALNAARIGMGRGECQIVRAADFHEVGGYNPTIAAGEDFDLYRRLAERGRIGYDKRSLVFESPRRFRKYGYTRVLWSWFINAISVLAFRRAVSDEWEAVR